MIISHRHKFIFIKTRKTAGTSVEIALSRHCGPEDVLTPTTPADETFRQDLGIYPRHYARWPVNLLVGNRINLHKVRKRKLKWIGKIGMRRFRQHMPAVEIMAQVPEEVWRTYTKITIERDPLDRIISRYYWDLSRGDCKTLEEFFRRETFDSNFEIYSIGGELAVDRILRFDRLTEDLNDLYNELGMPADDWLPRTKSTSRPRKKTWRQLLSEEQIHRVVMECAREYLVLAELGMPVANEVRAILPHLPETPPEVIEPVEEQPPVTVAPLVNMGFEETFPAQPLNDETTGSETLYGDGGHGAAAEPAPVSLYDQAPYAQPEPPTNDDWNHRQPPPPPMNR